MGTISRATDYSHSISGLLQKRADLFNEAERIRDRLAEIKNDIGAIAQLGVDEKEVNVRNKLSRGKFTAAYLLQCLEAIGTSDLRL